MLRSAEVIRASGRFQRGCHSSAELTACGWPLRRRVCGHRRSFPRECFAGGLPFQAMQVDLPSDQSSSFGLAQFDRDLLDDFDSEAFESGYFLGTISQQPDPTQVEVRENLRPYADLALHLSFGFVQGRKRLAAMKAERVAVVELLD